MTTVIFPYGGFYSRLLLLMATSLLIAVEAEVAMSSSNVAESFNCPSEVCRCGLDPRGRVKVVCDRGELGDPIPIRSMDPLTEVLVINAPDDKPNSLTIGPIFLVLINFIHDKLYTGYTVTSEIRSAVTDTQA